MLSKREIEVLILITKGLNNMEISTSLGLSTKTVENHVGKILLKLRAKNRTQAALIAIRDSIVDWTSVASDL